MIIKKYQWQVRMPKQLVIVFFENWVEAVIYSVNNNGDWPKPFEE